MADSKPPPVYRTKTTESINTSSGEFGYPLGHLGHLTEPQQSALEEFKKLCAEKGLYKPGTDGARGSHDDTTLLRFLRARRFNIQDAFEQFKDTEKWREANQISAIYETIDVKEYDETRRLYPQWTGRRDKRGIPVYLFEVAPLNSKTMSAYAKSSAKTSIQAPKSASTPARMLRLFALYENLVTFTMPLCTALRDRPNPDTPISQSNNIVDISNVGLKQFWNLRGHMQDASTLATAHYPETLDRIFIIGAPSFFPTVWGWIKRWFDPITTSKIFILSSTEVLPTLTKFIEPANIPRKYGGELDFAFGNPPVLDPELLHRLEWLSSDVARDGSKDKNKTFSPGPMKWSPLPNGDIEALAMGSVGGNQIKQAVAVLHTKRQEDTIEEKQPLSEQEKTAPQSTQAPAAPEETTTRVASDAADGKPALETYKTAPEFTKDAEMANGAA